MIIRYLKHNEGNQGSFTCVGFYTNCVLMSHFIPLSLREVNECLPGLYGIQEPADKKSG
jgi:hypothetical protein